MVNDNGLTLIAARVKATRHRLSRLAFVQAFWPALVFGLLYLAVALSGGLDRLGKLAGVVAALVFFSIGALLLLRGLRRYRGVDTAAAAAALDRQSELRPIAALTDRPADPARGAGSLWQAHRARLIAELRNLRLPRLTAQWKALDPYLLRAILPIAILGLALLAGPAGPGRLVRAFAPDYGVLVGADRMVVEAWVTPPEHTGRAPIFLKPGAANVRVPTGSEITLRTQASSAPQLVVSGRKTQRVKFRQTPDNAYEAKARLVTDSRVTVHWWGPRARWSFLVQPDDLPEIEFVSMPVLGAQDKTEFGWSATDDYGIAGIELEIRLQEPHPAAPEAEDRVPVPLPGGAGLTNVADQTKIDLTRHRWAGLGVEVRLVAIDGAGQEGFSEPARFVLPEKLFLDPMAKVAQEARVTVLREPRPYADLKKNPLTLLDGSVNTAATGRLGTAPPGVQHAALMLESVTYKGERFFDDLGVFMGFRTAFSMLSVATAKREADAVDALLWTLALKVEYGSAADAFRRLEAARRALEQALRDGASEEDIKRLMQAFRDAANQYLAAKMAEAMASGVQDAPSTEDQAAQAGGPGLGGQDFEDMLNALQDLTETGASDQARQLLADITNMLENLEFQRGDGSGKGMPGMPNQQAGQEDDPDAPPEEQQLTDAMRRLSEILREQRELNDDTLAQERGEAPRSETEPGLGQNQPSQQAGESDQSGQDQSGGQQAGQGTGRGDEQDGQGQGGREQAENDARGQGGGRPQTLAERQALLGQLVERLARERGQAGGGEGEDALAGRLDPEALRAIREAQRRAEQALQDGNERRAAGNQELATQQLSELTRDIARALDEMRAGRLGETGNPNDPLGRAQVGVGNDGTGVEIPEQAERQRAKDILDELRERYGKAEDEEEKEYLRRLLDRF